MIFSKAVKIMSIMGVIVIISGCGTSKSSDVTISEIKGVNSKTETNNADSHAENKSSSLSTKQSNLNKPKSTDTATTNTSITSKVDKSSNNNNSNISPNKKSPNSSVAYMGQNVQVGDFQIVVPPTTKTPVLRSSNNNVFVFGDSANYFFIEVDVKNISATPQNISSQSFEFTWTPIGGSKHFYVPNTTEEYNLNTSTYKNGTYYFANPFLHSVAPGGSEEFDLVFNIPEDMSPYEKGTIGIFAHIDSSHTQQFDLSSLN